MRKKYIKLTKLEYEGKLQIDAALAKLDADIDSLDENLIQGEIDGGEHILNMPSDYDDNSELLNHHEKEPWGHVR
jgi:hypothetical protein